MKYIQDQEEEEVKEKKDTELDAWDTGRSDKIVRSVKEGEWEDTKWKRIGAEGKHWGGIKRSQGNKKDKGERHRWWWSKRTGRKKGGGGGRGKKMSRRASNVAGLRELRYNEAWNVTSLLEVNGWRDWKEERRGGSRSAAGLEERTEGNKI